MKMVLVDCAIQNESTDNLPEYETTNNLRTNGTLTEVDSENKITTVAIPVSPSISKILPREPHCDIPAAHFTSSDFGQKINSDHSRIPVKSKLPILTSKRSILESKLTHWFNTNDPLAKQTRILITSESQPLTNANKFFETESPFLKLFTHRVVLRKSFSEPCFFFENGTAETCANQKFNSDRIKGFIKDTPMLITFEMETPRKSVPKLISGIPRSKNFTKNFLKPSNTAPCPKLARCMRSPVDDLKKSKKISKGIQVESPETKEVESQTDYKNDVLRPAKRKKETSSTDEKDSYHKSEMKKTVVTPFSFMDRCQAYLERKRERMIDKKYELKRWARPALILQKKPYKLVLPEIKLTVPQSVSFETDRRREKWAQYMKEFNERQEKLKSEEKFVTHKELQKFRNTLVPKIHKVPYKKLGIKPRKAINSNKKHAKPKNSTRSKKQNVENNSYPTANKKHTKLPNSNTKQSKQKSIKKDKILTHQNIEIEFRASRKHPTKTSNKNPDDGKTYNQKIAITINEKRTPNFKNSAVLFSNKNNSQIKISTPNKKESSLIKNNFMAGNAITARDDDGLYERYSTNSLSRHNSRKL